MKRNEHIHWEMWNPIKCTTKILIGIPEESRGQKRVKEMMTDTTEIW